MAALSVGFPGDKKCNPTFFKKIPWLSNRRANSRPRPQLRQRQPSVITSWETDPMPVFRLSFRAMRWRLPIGSEAAQTESSLKARACKSAGLSTWAKTGRHTRIVRAILPRRSGARAIAMRENPPRRPVLIRKRSFPPLGEATPRRQISYVPSINLRKKARLRPGFPSLDQSDPPAFTMMARASPVSVACLWSPIGEFANPRWFCKEGPSKLIPPVVLS